MRLRWFGVEYRSPLLVSTRTLLGVARSALTWIISAKWSLLGRISKLSPKSVLQNTNWRNTVKLRKPIFYEKKSTKHKLTSISIWHRALFNTRKIQIEVVETSAIFATYYAAYIPAMHWDPNANNWLSLISKLIMTIINKIYTVCGGIKMWIKHMGFTLESW